MTFNHFNSNQSQIQKLLLLFSAVKYESQQTFNTRNVVSVLNVTSYRNYFNFRMSYIKFILFVLTRFHMCHFLWFGTYFLFLDAQNWLLTYVGVSFTWIALSSSKRLVTMHVYFLQTSKERGKKSKRDGNALWFKVFENFVLYCFLLFLLPLAGRNWYKGNPLQCMNI